MTSTVPLPSSATNSRPRRRSTAMWSMRPPVSAAEWSPRARAVARVVARPSVYRAAHTDPPARTRLQATARRQPSLASGQVDLVQGGPDALRQLGLLVDRPEVHEEQS